MNNLAQKLKNLPQRPGVYLFKNARGEILYVGKAKNLKNRVRSYFQKTANLPARTRLLVAEIADLDYVIVSSETESLILENNFIKEHLPRFNVRLRDDKNYQFLKIDYDAPIPQVYAVRKLEKTNSRAKYFGPYTSAAAVKQTLHLLKRLFHLCGNKKISSRPCFQYHLGRCPGVCIGKIPIAEYRQTLLQVEAFLNHRQGAILKTLKREMLAAARARAFEKAAALRDKLKSLWGIWEKQKIVFARPDNADYFSLFAKVDSAIVNLFAIREGRLIHQETFELIHTRNLQPAEILDSFLKQYYTEATSIPRTVVVKTLPPNQPTLEKVFGFRLRVPRRGKKFQLLKLGAENAQEYFEKNFASVEAALQTLQQFLRLPRLPRRIEAYDISNIQGRLPVGSMVVFENGEPKKSAYRKFKIQLPETPNDFAMMAEMLERRFRHQDEKNAWPQPDLVVIDGGKGQLSAALKVLRKSEIQNPKFKIIGLAKRLEEIFLPGQKTSLHLPPNSPALFLLQRLRDEAHRFAITFYRSRHRREQIRSRLEEIAGIGPILRKKLLRAFGSTAAVHAATLKNLAEVVGWVQAKKIKEQL